MSRPPISVVVPFFGDAEDAWELLGALGRLALGPGDEVLVADNTPDATYVRVADGRTGAFSTRIERQPYSARNEAADRARGEWLLFTDADCRPAPDLLDAYLDDRVDDRVGALAGDVVALPGRSTWAARYGEDRRLLSPELFLAHPYRPMAVTANLLVRRSAFEQVGGFAEGIRSGGDADLCWRLQEAGWKLEHRPGAVVEHAHRETVPALLRQAARTSAGARWLERRHPGSRPGSRPVRAVLRALAGVVLWPLRGQPQRGALMAIEALVVVAESAGSLGSNARRRAPSAAERGFVALEAPDAWDGGYLEAARRARHGPRCPPGAVFAEDDGPLRRLVDSAVVATRHPVTSARVGRSLPELAPAARRLRRMGVRCIDPATEADRERAAALRRLTGMS